ncbi:MAG: DUF559 domain-containing protein [Solirubrobacterales bacterium]
MVSITLGGGFGWWRMSRGRQHGVVDGEQLRRIGLGRGAIEAMLDRGRLHSVHRGVYAVGHTSLSVEGRWMAAVLATGRGAVLSHSSAATLWRVLARPQAVIDVTARGQRKVPGVTVHRRRLLPDEVTVCAAIPVTSPARTLFDLAAVVSPVRVERAVNEAEVLRLADALSLDELVMRYRGRRGVAVIRSILAEGRIGLEATRSELEARFLGFAERFDLPRPATNAQVSAGGRRFECDCVWREHGLVVELDGRQFHDTPMAYERDRLRDRWLSGAGWTVVRVTWRQLHDEPAALAADLRRLLARPLGPTRRE